jgi:ATP-binding cassette, subfamily F, member 3
VQKHLNSENVIFDEFIEKTHCPFGNAFGYLNKYLFDKTTIKKKVNNLSPGERARLAFAIFAYNDYDLLILDEPDNHLDIETKEVIEKSLSEYEGTLLLVSHDRYFVESLGITRVLNLRNGKFEYTESV